jgi:pimeloyl-ACP methyl ester carboxylesterase
MQRPWTASERFVTAGGVRVRCLTDGEGDPPVVLLHGGGIDAAPLSWKHVAPALAGDYGHRVVAVDWPGYGESDSPADAPTMEYYVAVLGDVLDALDESRVHLVGESMGGGVALTYALDDPERVATLTLVDAYGLGGRLPGGRLAVLVGDSDLLNDLTWWLLRRSRLATRLALRAAVAPGRLTRDLVDDARTELRRPDAGRAWRRFQRSELRPAGLRTNHLDDLPDLGVPTLVLHGELDPLVPVSWAVRAGGLLPDAEVRVLPGCGHWPPRERPDAVTGRLAAFLQSKTPAER